MALFGLLTSFNHESQAWQEYKGRLTQWFIANDIGGANDTAGVKRRAVLLSALSEQTYKLAADLALPKDLQAVPFEDILQLLDNHFTPQKCGFAERYKFYTAEQVEGESYPQWAARLRGLTAHCGFLNVEEALRDRFVMGMLPGAEREKLFAQDLKTLSLAKAVERAEGVRCARLAAAATTAAVAAPAPTDQLFKIASKNGGGDKVSCSVCGFKNHTSVQCRFANYKCKKCNKKGHLRRMCKKINYVANEGVDDNGDDGEFYNICSYDGEPMTETVNVRGVQMKFQIDSGSAVTAISEKTYLKLFNDVPLSKTNKRLFSYTGNKIECIGVVRLPFTYTGNIHTLDVYIIRDGGPPLLGRDFISKYKLTMLPVNYCDYLTNISKQLQSKYPSVFSDKLGAFNKCKIKLNLMEDAKPIFFKPRPIAFALRDKIDKEIDRLVSAGVLKPVAYSEYASPVVPVLKRDGSIRLCADYSVTINKQLLVDQYPLPTAHELFTKLHGGQQFSKLDLSQAYAQCILDDESQKITCINTHKGLFMYTRLVFGLACAPAIFQRIMEGVLSGMDGVLCMLDDVLVTGETREVHINRLHEVLRRLQDAGLTLQKSKCDFFKEEVEYLGYIINKHGLKKSPQKVTAISRAPVPKNVGNLQSFLGLVNYYRNFVPNASSILSPLYSLLQKNCKWHWDTKHENAFNTIKKILVSDQVLAHFDNTREVILTVDASPSGLGAVLSQVDANGTERPVSYASRTLNAAERGYSQIQKEATAIIFGVRRFHQYLYGRSVPFILRTDHKPLITIFGPHRGIPEVSANRLQRYAIFLSGYNFRIEYIRSVDNCADYLSRASLSDDTEGRTVSGLSEMEDRATYVNFVVDASMPITRNTLLEETQKDLKLAKVAKYILNGWPRKINDHSIFPYFLCKTQLSVENGIVMRGHKVVIPEVLQSRILSELHQSHLGIVKCKADARGRVWFPGIDKAIETMIASCNICVQLRPSPARAPLAVWPHPQQPFWRVHIDFLGPIKGQTYLVIVDAYSKWPEVYKVNNTSSAVVIAILYDFMSRFGLFHTLVSDNATSFVSDEFKNFCNSNGISHVTSPAYHPASNGQAESYVKVVKKGIKSCLLMSNNSNDNKNLVKYLFDYRNSVHATTGSAPAQLVFGRKLRSRLDLINTNTPPSSSSDILSNVVKHNQCLQSKAYGGTNKQCFKPGDKIMFKKYYVNKKFTWNRGVVIKRIGETVYLVKDSETLGQLKKHTNQLIPYKGTDHGATNQPRAGSANRPDSAPEYDSTTGDDESAVEIQVSEAQNQEGEGECEQVLLPSEPPRPEPESAEGEEEFYDASTTSGRGPTSEPEHEHAHYRSDLSGKALRPIPRVNYKPFFCIDL